MQLPDFNPIDEKPLDRLIDDAGFCSIFRSIGIIGDSLSSGEMEIQTDEGIKVYLDMYEHSWGQYMARKAGCRVENFSRGGMGAQMFCESFYNECGVFDCKEKLCQCYIIALGVNDANSPLEMGSANDICMEKWYNNKKTVAGYYGRIIQRIKSVQPDAKIFLVTVPKESNMSSKCSLWHDKFRDVIYDMADMFKNTYVIDLRQHAVTYDEKFREMFFMEGHMNPAGYLFTAKMIMSYMDYIIRHNFSDFKRVALIGTSYYHQGIDKD